MDIGKEAQALIDLHAKKTQHLSFVLRGTARSHYASGIQDCLRIMQLAALRDEEALAHKPVISGPLGVQPAHSALPSEEGGQNESET